MNGNTPVLTSSAHMTYDPDSSGTAFHPRSDLIRYHCTIIDSKFCCMRASCGYATAAVDGLKEHAEEAHGTKNPLYQGISKLVDSQSEDSLGCSTPLSGSIHKPRVKNAPVSSPSSSFDTSSFNTPSTSTTLSDFQRTSEHIYRPLSNNPYMIASTMPIDFYGVGGWVDETLIADSNSWYTSQSRAPLTNAALAHDTSSMQTCSSSDDAPSTPRGDHESGRQQRHFDRAHLSGKDI